MTDTFKNHRDELDSPATSAAAVTPNNSTNLSNVTRALYVGGAGDVAVEMLSGDTVTFSAAPVGTILPIRVNKVLFTGTTATLIIALH